MKGMNWMKTITRRLGLLLLLVTLAWKDAAAADFRSTVPFLAQAPVVDGKVAGNEWAAASVLPVLLDPNSASPLAAAGSLAIGIHEGKLYFLFVNDHLPRMPRSDAAVRDEAVWKDDSFEMWMNDGATRVHLLVNAKGVIYDARNGEASWNGSWQIAIGLIGTEFAVGPDVRRGFIVEGSIPLAETGLKTQAGTEWRLQAALNYSGNNPFCVWAPLAGKNYMESGGAVTLGGLPQRLERVTLANGRRELTLTGRFPGSTMFNFTGASPATWTFAGGDLDRTVAFKGGADVAVSITNAQFHFAARWKSELAVPVIAVPAPSRKSFYVRYDATRRAPTAEARPVKFTLEQGGKPVWEQSLAGAALGADQVWWVDYSGWQPGSSLALQVSEQNPAGGFDVVGTVPLRVPRPTPWENYQLPDLAELPAGFPALTADVRSVKVHGRELSFGKSPFLDTCRVAGEQILAGPVTLRGAVNGRELKWKVTAHELVKKTARAAQYQTTATAGACDLKVKTTVEFDGLVRLDWTLQPRGNRPVTISDLQFVIPLKKEHAALYYHYITENFAFSNTKTWNGSGAIGASGWRGPFYPIVWLGTTERGMTWFTESRAGLHPADPQRALEIRPREQQTELIVHVVERSRTLSQPVDYTFGIMPTPVRPFPYTSRWKNSRLVMLSAPAQLACKSGGHPAVHLINSARSMGPQGCYELDVVWHDNEAARTVTQIINHQDTLGRNLRLDYLPAEKQVRVSYQTPETGPGVLGTGAADLSGGLHRIAFNYGKDIEVYVDGKRVFAQPRRAALPVFDRAGWRELGGNGGLAFRAWRHSAAPRAPEELAQVRPLVSDGTTLHLTVLETDPTIMGVCDSQTGYLETPAYLTGDWQWDATARQIIPLRSRPATTLAGALAASGAGGVVFFDWSKLRTGHGPPTDPQQFAEMVKLAHAHGLKFIPYAPNGICSLDPAFADYQYEFSNSGPETEPPAFWVDRDARYCAGAMVASQYKYNLWNFENLMKLGCDGVYLDGTMYPNQAANPLVGISEVTDPFTGEKLKAFQIFSMRNWMLDMVRLLQRYKPDATVDAHASLGYVTPTMSVVTDATNGESLGALPDWRAALGLANFGAEYYSGPYGFAADALFYNSHPVPIEYGMALAGIYGQTPRASWGLHMARAERLWKLFDRLDHADTRFFLFNDPRNPVRTAAPVLASTAVRPGVGAAIFVVNWSDTPVTASLEIDGAALGLGPLSVVNDLSHGRSLPVQAGKIALEAKPYRILYLWISAPTK